MYLSEYEREMNKRKKKRGGGTLTINQEYLLYTPHLEKKRRQQGMDYGNVWEHGCGYVPKKIEIFFFVKI